MALEGIVRYSDMLKVIPTGSFYDSDGSVIPYYSNPVDLRLETPTPSTKFAIYINEVYSGETTTDFNGNVVLQKKLPLGEVHIRLVDTTSGRAYNTYLTTRSYATWLSAFAGALEDVDDQIQRVSDSLRIEHVQSQEIEEVFGKPLDTYRDFDIDLDSYRWLCQELRLSYRNFGGRFKGLEESIAEFTQIPPFGYTRRKWGPNWRVDSSMLYNYRFKNRSHDVYYGAGGADPEIDGVSLVKVEPNVATTLGVTHTLSYNSANNTLNWDPEGLGGSPDIEVDGDGGYFLPGPPAPEFYYPGQSTYAGVMGVAGNYNIVLGSNDHLYLNIDNRGVLDVTLTAGSRTASQIQTDINSAATADPRYGFSPAIVYVALNRVFIISNGGVATDRVEVLPGPNNAAGVLFGVNPGYLKFDKDVANGIEILDIYGEDFELLDNCDIELTYNGALTPPHRLRWKTANGSYGAYVSIGEDGIYKIEDSTNSVCRVRIDVSELSTAASTVYNFPIHFEKVFTLVKQHKGIWVNVDTSSLPAVNQSAEVVVYDDATDFYVEGPDQWFINYTPSNPYFFMSHSPFTLEKEDEYGPAPAYRWVVGDQAAPVHPTTGNNYIELVGRSERFPLIEGLPRGSNFPQKSIGNIYDYEGFEVKFSGRFKNYNQVADQNLILSLSFDGGDNWYDSSTTVLSYDPSAIPYVDYLNYEYVEFTMKIPAEVLYSSSSIFTDSGILCKIYSDSSQPVVLLSIDELNLKVKYITSSSLENATVSRSRHDQYFGELVYVWSPEALTLKEKEYLGVFHKNIDRKTPVSGINITDISSDTPAGSGTFEYEYNTGPTYRVRWNPNGDTWGVGSGWVSISGDGTYTFSSPGGSYLTASVDFSALPELAGTLPATRTRTLVITDLTTTPGHSRRVSPAHSKLEVVDATEYDSSGQPKNIKGIVTEGDFSTCTLTNCEIYSGTPFKFGHVRPSYNNQEGEDLIWSPSGPNYVATLDYESDQDQVEAVLYEGSLPVPNDQWSFTSSNTIEISGGYYSPLAVYTIDYNLLYQIVSPTIDLGVDFKDYCWFADYFLWERFDNSLGEYTVETPLYFNKLNGRAFLNKKSTANKSTASLVVQLNGSRVDIAKRYWRFISDSIVEIDVAQLVNGQYYLIHDEKRVYEESRLTKVFEHKSANTVLGLSAAPWTAIDRNSNVSTEVYNTPLTTTDHQYHQLRMSVRGIRDLKDFRLRSMLMKGLHLHGSDAYVSGLTNVWEAW